MNKGKEITRGGIERSGSHKKKISSSFLQLRPESSRRIALVLVRSMDVSSESAVDSGSRASNTGLVGYYRASKLVGSPV